MFKFELGDEVKDTVTTYTGVIIARSEYLNGCKQYCVKTRKLKDGKMVDGEWIDEGQLSLIAKDKLKIQKKNTGGPARGMRLPRL